MKQKLKCYFWLTLAYNEKLKISYDFAICDTSLLHSKILATGGENENILWNVHFRDSILYPIVKQHLVSNFDYIFHNFQSATHYTAL